MLKFRNNKWAEKLPLCTPWKHMWGWRYSSTHSWPWC